MPTDLEQVVLGLALREIRIPGIMADGSMPMVAEFPMLRGPCPPDIYLRAGGRCRLERRKYEVNRQYSEKYTEQDWLNHCWCQGRGWLPVVTTDALLEAGKPYGFWLNWSEGLKQWVVAVAEFLGFRVVGSGDTKEMALALALEATRK